ncbi:MAG: Lrp/AsnC family transcriptional regulator [Butyrivibrio sp.]|nr:Lrp/AsnC family transcriptional regulator [Muribaculum sp.]MCM1551240.1 Lrp/AsnC family transcriptional regulator [Butyrivibrio sp.]
MRERMLDEIDIQILNILQRDARTPIKQVAKAVNLSSPAVSNRIQRLEVERYIIGYQAQVDPIALGLGTKAFICLEIAPVQKKEFYPYIKQCKNVVECNCVTGDYSMLLEVLFENTIELDHFINELQRFGRTKTLIVFSTTVGHRGVEL